MGDLIMSKAPRAGTSSAPLVRAVVAAIGKEPQKDAARAFAGQAAADAAADELPELSQAELAAALADFWRFAERRRGRGPTLRIAPVDARKARLDRLEI